ncbi:VOC family protein [Streptomyces sp. NPDC056949]|uniref:VOC family protein n=1 Tax=Streptomyces sp. NPDC056949 TaxID=3345976 RepID=UPI0036440CC7
MGFATMLTVVVDCPQPRQLAEFYAAVLGGDIDDFRGDGSWVDLRPPAGQRMSFQLSPGLKPPDWPAADHDSQQLHLDLAVEDIDAAQQKVIALGARPLDLEDDGGKRDFRVFCDPVGHPFCLILQS